MIRYVSPGLFREYRWIHYDPVQLGDLRWTPEPTMYKIELVQAKFPSYYWIWAHRRIEDGWLTRDLIGVETLARAVALRGEWIRAERKCLPWKAVFHERAHLVAL